MPNNTVRAAAEGMPTLNRRQALAMSAGGLATAITVLSTVKPAPAATPTARRAKMSPELRAVINDHKKAHAYWLSVCDCADEVLLGRKATAEEDQTWIAGSDGEHSALWYVCRFPVRSPADIAAKGRYLKKFHSFYWGELQEDQVKALLLSMIEAGKGGAL
ncbi:hypothetical protein [Mesorhizobium sp. CO1-1-9]|uniref:hypothetical protein n=1 Tax=Mesorhizobium sp. CO1-1-9 TaxID=2876630 RepID=UPI001CCEA26B|nr:hypothetical protein [Mesorhizobium sp. CO1-1-9]MBZ9693955.1 hypothetical protein [Mesorhizobium sp. CO1-1-9]